MLHVEATYLTGISPAISRLRHVYM